MELDSKSDNQMIARAIACMEEDGVLYKEDGKPNVPELMRRAGISRQRARTIAAHGFRQRPHGNAGSSRSRVMTESEKSETARLLAKGVTNSSVIFRILVERHGYASSVSTIKRFRAAHRDLIPSPRFSVAKQGSRSRRYETAPGHMYQMDWGFINVLDTEGKAALCVDGGCSRTGTLRNASWTDSSTDPTASTSRGLRSEENTRSPLR